MLFHCKVSGWDIILIHRLLSIFPLHPGSSFRLLRAPMLLRITVRTPHPSSLFYTPLPLSASSIPLSGTRFSVISYRLLSSPSSIGLFLFRPDSIQDIISQKRNLKILALTFVAHLLEKVLLRETIFRQFATKY